MKTIVALAILVAVGLGVAFHFAGGQAKKTTSTLLAFPDQAAQATARANLSAALPALQAFAAQNGGYGGLTIDSLRQIDPSVSAGASLHDVSAAGACLQMTIRTSTASVTAPGGAIVDGPCP
jgi:hypothetical protein